MYDVMVVILIVLYIYLMITTIYLLLDNREVSSTLAWILVFVFLPLVGFVVYIFAGRNWRKKKRNHQIDYHLGEGILKDIMAPLVQRHERLAKSLKQRWRLPKYKNELVELFYQNSDALLTSAEDVVFYFSGHYKFSQLIKDIKAAKQYIFIEYFIWRNDSLTELIKDALIKKAGEGVKIKILTDSFGSFLLKRKYIRALRQAGIEIYKFYNFMSLVTFHTINYRNHRKIVVIDGRVGFTGGMNMGMEYINGGKKFDLWRDTHLRLQGQAVRLLEIIFAIDWYNTTHELILTPKQPAIIEKTKKEKILQIITSGPDARWPSITQMFFSLINAAQKRVFIQTPYFIPDPSIFMALKTAALRGLDVRLMVTGQPDKLLPYWSAFTYFEDLLRAGVRVYHYQAGFLHAKTISIDGELCSVGTANVDMRSFSLNYELNILIYDKTLSRTLEHQFLIDAKQACILTPSAYKKISTIKRLGHSLARLLTPLL